MELKGLALSKPVLISVQSFDRVIGGFEGRFSRDPLPVFSVGGHHEQFWQGYGCPLFDIHNPAFPLQTIAMPSF